MSSKTDKNFIYDYLIHLDSFLLHGVSEVGTPPQKSFPSNPATKKNLYQPYRNIDSAIAFVNIRKSKEVVGESIFSSNELQLFQKIVVAMGLVPENIYLTTIPLLENSETESDKNDIILFEKELSAIHSQYIVCLGASVANYFTKENIKSYHLQNCWQDLVSFEKSRVLITIPSMEEILNEPNHKKLVWALLKKAADQIHSKLNS